MGSSSATVEVLTAEVRVLMVGSRQVTLSVYNQLDRVEPDDIDPFGRVCPRDAERGWVDVVGASRRDADRGVLVRSRGRSAETLAGQADQWQRWVPLAREYEALAPKAAAMHEAYYQWINDTKRDGECPVDYGRLQEVEQRVKTLDRLPHPIDSAEYADAAEAATRDAQAAAAWETLPLIVLAGLR
jgi:hypothetical protein